MLLMEYPTANINGIKRDQNELLSPSKVLRMPSASANLMVQGCEQGGCLLVTTQEKENQGKKLKRKCIKYKVPVFSCKVKNPLTWLDASISGRIKKKGVTLSPNEWYCQ